MLTRNNLPWGLGPNERFVDWVQRFGFCRFTPNSFAVAGVEMGIKRLIGMIRSQQQSAESPMLDFLLQGCKGGGKKTLVKLAGKYFKLKYPQGNFIYCDVPVIQWARFERCPDTWWTADLLGLCDFWNEDAAEIYAEDLETLIKERRKRNKLTLLTTEHAVNTLSGMTDGLCKTVLSGLLLEVESAVEKRDIEHLIRWTNSRRELGLADSVVRHLASRLSGPSGSVIEQVMRVAKFAEENPAVPLINNVIDYALSNVA